MAASAEVVIFVKRAACDALVKIPEAAVVEIHGTDAVIVCQVKELPNRSVVEC